MTSESGHTNDNGDNYSGKLDGDLLIAPVPPLPLEMSSITIPSISSPRQRDDTCDNLSARSKNSQKSQKTKDEVSKSSLTRQPMSKISSSIPLPVKSPKPGLQKSPPTRATGKLSRASSSTIKSLGQVTNKHTLEIQFLNKKKRLVLLKKELAEKQKPVLDLYQNLVQIKKRLEELGKMVFLEEVKVINCSADGDPDSGGDAGESISPDVILGMKNSIEEIPKTLMEICKNLLARRNVIVELLDSVVKSEVDIGDLKDQIETLKSEGSQLQSNLDVVINEHHDKIKEIVRNWQALLNDKRQLNTNATVVELQEKMKVQEKLVEDSKSVIQDLQRRLDDRKLGQDRYVNELNNTIHGLRDQIQKLEQELETEKKLASDYKNRNNANAQSSKILRNKIAELENDKKTSESLSDELGKKVKLLQDQLKHKESQWSKERDELTKSLRHQENLLQKVTADKQNFETRLETVQGERTSLEVSLQNQIDDLQQELQETKSILKEANKQKNDALGKCQEMEEHISRLGIANKENMSLVTSSIDWGKDVQGSLTDAQMYSQNMMKDIMLREYEDKVKKMDQEICELKKSIIIAENEKSGTDTKSAVLMQHEVIAKYKQLLAESEQRLLTKTHEVTKLTAELRQLRVRQEHLEEVNMKCPTDDLQRMLEEGRNKLNELMKKSMESEQKILHQEGVIDKQSKTIHDLENLVRYRENMTSVLKTSRDELMAEKQSLTRYSQEMRTVLAEVTKESKLKDRLIKELQEKIELREKQMNKLEKEIRGLEQNLLVSNERRFKLQETLAGMEQELQSAKANITDLADINTRYEIGMNYHTTISQDSNQINAYFKGDCNYDYNQKMPNKVQVSKSRVVFESVEALLTNNMSLKNIKNPESMCLKKVNFQDQLPNNLSESSKHKLNSKSLIDLSLKQVDFLKARIKHLTEVNAIPSVSDTKLVSPSQPSISSEPNRSLNKIIQLNAKRYEFFQKQAYESYEELTNLVKLAISTQKVPEK